MRVPSPESNGSLQAVEKDKNDFVDGGEVKQNFDQLVDFCCAYFQKQAYSYSFIEKSLEGAIHNVRSAHASRGVSLKYMNSKEPRT